MWHAKRRPKEIGPFDQWAIPILTIAGGDKM
jgi:hypothetical protein